MTYHFFGFISCILFCYFCILVCPEYICMFMKMYICRCVPECRWMDTWMVWRTIAGLAVAWTPKNSLFTARKVVLPSSPSIFSFRLMPETFARSLPPPQRMHVHPSHSGVSSVSAGREVGERLISMCRQCPMHNLFFKVGDPGRVVGLDRVHTLRRVCTPMLFRSPE